MHTPSLVYDYKGEWFEIHNTTSERLNINGLKITSIDGGDFSITEDVVIDAEGYAVIGSRRSPLDNGGVEMSCLPIPTSVSTPQTPSKYVSLMIHYWTKLSLMTQRSFPFSKVLLWNWVRWTLIKMTVTSMVSRD